MVSAQSCRDFSGRAVQDVRGAGGTGGLQAVCRRPVPMGIQPPRAPHREPVTAPSPVPTHFSKMRQDCTKRRNEVALCEAVWRVKETIFPLDL